MERALRDPPHPPHRSRQSALGQDEAAEDKQRGARWAAGPRARQQMEEPDNGGPEKQARDHHRQLGPGKAGTPLWMLISLRLGMVRVAERCRAAVGCVDRAMGDLGGGCPDKLPISATR